MANFFPSTLARPRLASPSARPRALRLASMYIYITFRQSFDLCVLPRSCPASPGASARIGGREFSPAPQPLPSPRPDRALILPPARAHPFALGGQDEPGRRRDAAACRRPLHAAGQTGGCTSLHLAALGCAVDAMRESATVAECSTTSATTTTATSSAPRSSACSGRARRGGRRGGDCRRAGFRALA